MFVSRVFLSSLKTCQIPPEIFGVTAHQLFKIDQILALLCFMYVLILEGRQLMSQDLKVDNSV